MQLAMVDTFIFLLVVFAIFSFAMAFRYQTEVIELLMVEIMITEQSIEQLEERCRQLEEE